MRIPRRDEGAVNLNPVPGNRLSSPSPIEAFGGQFAQDVATVGKALGKVGDAALDAYEKERDRNEVALVTSKLAETDRKIDALHKDRVSKIGEYISDSPQRAETLTDALVTDSESAYNEAANSITDPRIRKRFEDEALRSRELRKSKAAEIESKGWDSYRIGKQTEAVDTSAAAAVESYKDPEAFDIHADRVRKGAANIDSINGVVEEDPNSATKKVMSSLYERAVSAAIDANDAKSAEALLAKGRDAGWVSKERGKLDDAVDGVKWFGEASLLTRQHSTESAALAALNKQSMPEKERSEKAKVIKQQFAERERLIKQQEEDASRYANDYFDKTGKLPPLQILERMSSPARRALDAYARKVARGDMSFDPEIYSDLQSRLTQSMIDGTKFPEDVANYRDVLGSKYAAFERSVAMWNKKVDDGTTSDGQRIKLYTDGLTKTQVAEFQAAYHEDVAAAEAGGKILDSKGREEIMKRLRVEVAIPNKYMPWDTHKRAYMLPKEQRASLRNGESMRVIVPDEIRARIMKDYNPGADVSEDVIVDRYLKGDYL